MASAVVSPAAASAAFPDSVPVAPDGLPARAQRPPADDPADQVGGLACFELSAPSGVESGAGVRSNLVHDGR